MTALAEALLAAQRQAIGALSKAFVAERIDSDTLFSSLDLIGCRDVVEQGELLQSLTVLLAHGAAAPAPPNGKPDPATEPASESQMKYLRDLADKKGTTAPDWPLSKAQAHEVIDALKAGSYDPDKWTAPF